MRDDTKNGCVADKASVKMGMDFIGQVPAVQTLNSAIHRINHYPAHDPADKYLGTNYAINWIEIYPSDSTIHLLNNWGQI